MELMMYLGNDLIESVPVNNSKISEPGYLGSFKRTLKLRHNDLISQAPIEPEFLVSIPYPVTNIYSSNYSSDY